MSHCGDLLWHCFYRRPYWHQNCGASSKNITYTKFYTHEYTVSRRSETFRSSERGDMSVGAPVLRCHATTATAPSVPVATATAPPVAVSTEWQSCPTQSSGTGVVSTLLNNICIICIPLRRSNARWRRIPHSWSRTRCAGFASDSVPPWGFAAMPDRRRRKRVWGWGR